MTAALLIAASLLGAECQRSRAYHSQHQIMSIAAMLAAGGRDAIGDLRGRMNGGKPDVQLDWQSVRLTFGERWHLQYSLTFKGLSIMKQTWVGIDYLAMRADIWGQVSEDLDYAMFAFVASQDEHGTHITSWLHVHTPRGDRCFLVRNIAERRVMPPLVDSALAKAETAVLSMAHRVDVDPLVTAIDSLREEFRMNGMFRPLRNRK